MELLNPVKGEKVKMESRSLDSICPSLRCAENQIFDLFNGTFWKLFDGVRLYDNRVEPEVIRFQVHTVNDLIRTMECYVKSYADLDNTEVEVPDGMYIAGSNAVRYFSRSGNMYELRYGKDSVSFLWEVGSSLDAALKNLSCPHFS